MRLYLLFFLCLLTTMSAAQLKPAELAARAATHVIAQATISSAYQCSATAIGPHALLTASHCELPTDSLFMDESTDKVKIADRIRDEYDHTIYLLKGVTFEHYSSVRLNDAFAQGEEVFVFGNPGTWENIFRRGYITGTCNRFPISQILYSFEDDHGDSGAGVFAADGALITVISRREPDGDPETAGLSLAASFALHFTPADITRAAKF